MGAVTGDGSDEPPDPDAIEVDPTCRYICTMPSEPAHYIRAIVHGRVTVIYLICILKRPAYLVMPRPWFSGYSHTSNKTVLSTNAAMFVCIHWLSVYKLWMYIEAHQNELHGEELQSKKDVDATSRNGHDVLESTRR